MCKRTKIRINPRTGGSKIFLRLLSILQQIHNYQIKKHKNRKISEKIMFFFSTDTTFYMYPLNKGSPFEN